MAELSHKDVDIIEDDDPTEELPILPGHVLEADDDSPVAETFSAANQPFASEHLDVELRKATEEISSLSSELRSRTETMQSIQHELDQLRGFSEFLAKEVDSGKEVISGMTDELVSVRTQQNDVSEQLRRRDQQITALRERIARKDALIEEYARQADSTSFSDGRGSDNSQQGDENLQDEHVDGRENTVLRSERAQSDRQRMIVARHDDGALRYPIPPGGISLGTSSENDVQLQNAFVSYRHASLTETGAGCVLKDLGSSNGTWINQRRIKWQVLRDGDLFDIGPLRFEFIDKPPEIQDDADQ